MKKLILLLCFGIISAIAGTSSYKKTIYIPFAPQYRPYEALWQAMCITESSNNPNAVGDLKLRNKSYGIAQIRQPRLDDYYNHTRIRYTTYDMFDTTKSKSVFMWYATQKHYTEVEAITREWNAGPSWRKNHSSKKYYLKVREIMLSL